MEDKEVPRLGRKAFKCPHCGAFTTQNWFVVKVTPIEGDVIARQNLRHEEAKEQYFTWEDFYDCEIEEDMKDTELWAYNMYLGKEECSEKATKIENSSYSQCLNCKKLTIWLLNKMIYPAVNTFPKNIDMPTQVAKHYDEANDIFNKSPRGAAALLRLAIEELLNHLGVKGNTLKSKIDKVVKDGIDPKIEKALEIVRITGNHAVHPGKIDFDDNREDAELLFELINLITKEFISKPKEIDRLYEKLPSNFAQEAEMRKKS